MCFPGAHPAVCLSACEDTVRAAFRESSRSSLAAHLQPCIDRLWSPIVHDNRGALRDIGSKVRDDKYVHVGKQTHAHAHMSVCMNMRCVHECILCFYAPAGVCARSGGHSGSHARHVVSDWRRGAGGHARAASGNERSCACVSHTHACTYDAYTHVCMYDAYTHVCTYDAYTHAYTYDAYTYAHTRFNAMCTQTKNTCV